jgi:hypothetical protein
VKISEKETGVLVKAKPKPHSDKQFVSWVLLRFFQLSKSPASHQSDGRKFFFDWDFYRMTFF